MRRYESICRGGHFFTKPYPLPLRKRERERESVEITLGASNHNNKVLGEGVCGIRHLSSWRRQIRSHLSPWPRLMASVLMQGHFHTQTTRTRGENHRALKIHRDCYISIVISLSCRCVISLDNTRDEISFQYTINNWTNLLIEINKILSFNLRVCLQLL